MSLFTGSFLINMDAKGRIAIPTKVRETLADACSGRITITADPRESCLLIYPDAEWQTLAQKLLTMPNLNEAAGRLQRILLGHATDMELDGNGRILLPPTLRDYASMEKKLMLLGLGKKYELWSEELYRKWLARQANAGELTAAMQELSL